MRRLALLLLLFALPMFAQSIPQGTLHSAALSWQAPNPVGGSGVIAGYNIYRTPQGPPNYTKLNAAVIPGLSFVDGTVAASTTYGYCATTVDSKGSESACTLPVSVNVPSNPAVPTSFSVTVN